MSKVNNKTKGFGSIPRDVVYDKELSDRARFLYVYMACKPEEWEFYQDKVAEELGYGKDTLRKYLDELIIRGWITENEQQNDGKFGCLEYDIEVKRKVGNLPIRKKADTEKTRNGKIPNQRNIDNNSTINSPIIERDNAPTPTRISDDELNREQGLLLGNSQWIEVICMKHKITLDTFRDMVADFILDCRCNAQNRHQDEQDLRSHFNNWLRIKLQSNGNNRPNINAGYRKPSPEDNIRTVEQWALEQTRKCLSGEADRERERLSEGLPF